MSSREPTDSELIERCLEGDGTAWEALVRRYRRLVYSVPVKMHLAPHEADDVFQDTFAALFEKLSTVRDHERVGLWLAATARRRVLNLVQRGPRPRETEIGEGEDWEAPGPLPDAELMRLERAHALRRALARLRPRCRQLLEAFLAEDPPPAYEDVARRLGMAEGSVGPTRQRCLRQLREELARLGAMDAYVGGPKRCLLERRGAGES